MSWLADATTRWKTLLMCLPLAHTPVIHQRKKEKSYAEHQTLEASSGHVGFKVIRLVVLIDPRFVASYSDRTAPQCHVPSQSISSRPPAGACSSHAVCLSVHLPSKTRVARQHGFDSSSFTGSARGDSRRSACRYPCWSGHANRPD
jgi:hypothetical protein